MTRNYSSIRFYPFESPVLLYKMSPLGANQSKAIPKIHEEAGTAVKQFIRVSYNAGTGLSY